MSTITIAHSSNLQLQSPLLRLPTEIKHVIYTYCLTTPTPIIDPVATLTYPDTPSTSHISIALLQTCRRIYHEADRRPLFTQNKFRFTSVDRVRSFFRYLPASHRSLIQDLEIDAGKVHSDHPGIGREWLQYLAWSDGPWAKLLGSLREDASGLKCLQLNFGAWPSIPIFRAELWNLLRSMLLHVRGLERIVVIGASKGAAMARREPWSPVHYVGGDDVGSDDLIQRMWRVVGEDGDEDKKVIRWTRLDDQIYLEVVTKTFLFKNVDQYWPGPGTRAKHTDPWPENGSCTWSAYLNRNSDAIVERAMKGINPNFAE